MIGIYKNGKLVDEYYYNELIRVNNDLIPRWNIKVSLDKISELQKISGLYNVYFLKDGGNNIGFGIITNEDGEDKNCSDIKKEFQIEKDENFWLANFFIYPEYRGKGYGNKFFSDIYNLLSKSKKSFYLYTDKNNFVRKIYSNYMLELGEYNKNNKSKIIYYKNFNEK